MEGEARRRNFEPDEPETACDGDNECADDERLPLLHPATTTRGQHDARTRTSAASVASSDSGSTRTWQCCFHLELLLFGLLGAVVLGLLLYFSLCDLSGLRNPFYEIRCRPPVCIRAPFYGQNSNRILSLANALRLAQEKRTTVAMDGAFSDWYDDYFDPRPDVFRRYRGLCSESHAAGHYYGRYPNDLIGGQRPELVRLRPKQALWHAAQQAVSELPLQRGGGGGSFISVPRRWLESLCLERAEAGATFCAVTTPTISALAVADACTWVQRDIEVAEEKAVSGRGQQQQQQQQEIVLFTDGQEPLYDKTFTLVDHQPFAVQLCMMALSARHYGNPLSSVDYLVAHWRPDLSDSMEPSLCWQSPATSPSRSSARRAVVVAAVT